MTLARKRQTAERLFFSASAPKRSDFLPVAADLDQIFSSSSLGFRELLATVVYGMALDHQYNPRVSLYDCHPRALYEQDIRPALRSRGIPCGQSGPLNIAKATQALNEQWAAQRRPRAHADALLRVVDFLIAADRSLLPQFAAHLGQRFSALALEVLESQNNLGAVDSGVHLSQTLQALLTQFPLGGSTPQFVCGVILETFALSQSGITVEGARDSVSTTNRTSRKVGDIAICRDGRPYQIFEVTVKSFSLQRVSEALQSLEVFFEGQIPPDTVVHVLCRAEDVPSELHQSGSSGYLGELKSGGVIFEFLDIYEWIAMSVAALDLAGRRAVHGEVQEFLNGPRIASEVRRWWASAHA